MRVTDQTKQKAVIHNINNNSEELQTLMTNVSSGKRINRPSDDPVGIVIGQDYRTTINHVNTISRNIIADKIWLDSMESSITQMGSLLMRAKELAVQAADGSMSAESRIVVAEETDALMDSVIKLGNAKEGKIYLFSGTKTLTKPLKRQEPSSSVHIEYSGTRIKSQSTLIPLSQVKPLTRVKAGEMHFNLIDEEGVTTEMVVKLDGGESLKEIVKKINLITAAEEAFEETETSPTGYKNKFFAQIGVDDSLYLDPTPGYLLQLGEDTTGVFEIMRFGVVGNDFGTNPDLPKLSDTAFDPAEYESKFEGFSNDDYIIRVIQSGGFGSAKYIISDDNGETWSQPSRITQKVAVYNPEGKAKSPVELKFASGRLPFFQEGVEFHFKGHPLVEYLGNNDVKDVLVDSGIKIPLNITAKQIFFESDEKDSLNVFDVLYRLKEAMLNDDQTAIVKSVGDIDRSYNQVLKRRGQVGIIGNQFESSEKRIDQTKFSKTQQLSELEDLDLPKAIIDLNAAEVRNKVSLDAGARLIQPTLMQFLK